MEYGVYLSAAGALAAETQLDVIAHNMANLDTPGFKRNTITFQQRLMESMEPPKFDPSKNPVLDQIGGGLFVHEVNYDRATGPLLDTGRDLDMALVGEGWFTVDSGGERLYTRAGNFLRNPSGFLTTADGQGLVLDTKNAPIQLPPRGRVLIDEAGSIFVDDKPLTRLQIRGALDEEFVPQGNNFFRYTGKEPAPPESAAHVMQGNLERSTVSPVHEMVAMIRAFRGYESNQRMITQQDQTLGRAVNDVGRLG